jgi:prephenate dehydratase
MADIVRKVTYFSIQVPNRTGAGVGLLTALRDAGVNLLAFTGFPSGRKAQVDFIPDHSAQLLRVARKNKWRLSQKKTAFLVQGPDRAGALTDTLEILAKARINVTAMDAVCAGNGRYGAIFWVKPKDIARTSKLLGVA